MDWTGGCLCGAVRYQSAAAPERVVHCHCSMCRRLSGAAFLTLVGFPAVQFRWVAGEASFYESSQQARRGFCSACGSTLVHLLSSEDWRVFVALGSLDQADKVAPDEHCFYRDKLSWLELDDDLPRLAQGRHAKDLGDGQG